MSNQTQENLDMNELTKLTPFGLDVYNNPGKFASGNIFVKTHILESAKPLQPWHNQVADTLTLEETSGSDS